MAGVTIFALFSWWFTPESAWLPKTRITHFIGSTGEGDLAVANNEVSVESNIEPVKKFNHQR